MPEYGVELPLWLAEWWHLGLESGLLDDLADWQATFDANFDPFEGWKDDTARERWWQDAEVLVTRLEDALPTDVVLVINLWPPRQ